MPSRVTVTVSTGCHVAEDVKRRLLKVPNVKKVDVLGKQAERVYLDILARASGRARRHASRDHREPQEPEQRAPDALIDTRSDKVFVRVGRQFTSTNTCPSVVIEACVWLTRLGDFATVTRGFEDPRTYTGAPQRPAVRCSASQ